ncbi:uncharacterized protein Z519_06568 [Cladophialophora bantiana CBS 173.52]|uniref:Phenazine biosynthesis protein n=1 Tax=Cladophialophora bantiana (strain ATCC 10958 / CBS 173.52 / CDC B-1940 / NIH 8579) TaxID=1442370 RepID=A0A0D2HPE8_CLAB1|nr:uncharacterized protein Z519_06568 [Cladophialophora bantiana CBS 173.52]KIW92720.1 hypothetical protein Z519_06568 [Cladophialophora bantiana CBS 173.52]
MTSKSRDNTQKQVHHVNVFTSDEDGCGGNLAPIVLHAEGLTDEDMQGAARKHGRESSFVTPKRREDEPGDDDGNVDFHLRFFVPEHEMEMCGHATVGTAWVMHELGVVGANRMEITFMTKSGRVRTRRMERKGEDGQGRTTQVFVSQPAGTVADIVDQTMVEEILSVLGISESQLQTTPRAVQNACTSRVKTAIALRDAAVVNALKPDFSRVRGLCERLGSTGLYPYAIVQGKNNAAAAAAGGDRAGQHPVLEVEARQFPKASGYPEDAATGIAAAALAYALADNGVLRMGQEAVVHQGRAMGYQSRINVLLEEDGCWVGGTCAWDGRSG